MLLVSRIRKRNCLLGLLLLGSGVAGAQENSPFSRYGMGDIYPSQQVNARAMGGMTAAYMGNINFSNPASYVNFAGFDRNVVMDVGLMYDSRSLKSANPSAKFSSKYLVPSYFAFGTPISRKRGIGFAFGLTPMTRINYSVNQNQRISGVDSLTRLYEGTGGMYKAFLGVAKKFKDLSIGVNTGYIFGNKDINTRTIFLNDTVSYYKSNHETKTSFGHVFAEVGFQYRHYFKLDTTDKVTPTSFFVAVGGTTQFKQHLNASQDIYRQTFDYDANTATYVIDSVATTLSNKGKIQLPATYTAGFMIGRTFAGIVNKWAFGAEYTTSKWTDYRFYNQADRLTNSWALKVGGEITPVIQRNGFFKPTYRAGFSIGKDYINADGNELKSYGITFGGSFPIKKHRGAYNFQSSTINTAFEFGKRGSNVNNITESYFRLTVGLSLTDLWFRKTRYD